MYDYLHTMKVLIWKQFKIKKATHIWAIVELAVPIFVMFFLILIRNFINPEPEKPNNSTALILRSNVWTGPLVARILYKPYTPLSVQIMTEVGKTLQLEQLDDGAPDHFRSGYWIMDAIQNKDLRKFIKTMRRNEVIVVFNNLGGDNFPDRFVYTIRMKMNFLKRARQHSSTASRHRYHDPGAMYYVFSEVQWAIDKSFIKLRSGKYFKKDIILEELPQKRASGTATESPQKKINMFDFQTLTWLSIMLPFIFTCCRLLCERTSGIVEAMKMLGMNSIILFLSHIVIALPLVIIYGILGTIFVTIAFKPYHSLSSPIVIFMALVLYYINMIAIAITASFMRRTAKHSMWIIYVLYIVLFLPCLMLYRISEKHIVLLISIGLLPTVPIFWFYDQLASHQANEQSLGFAEMFSNFESNLVPVAFAFLMMIVQTIIYLMFAWYIDKIYPGPCSLGLPWHFICERNYWLNTYMRPVIVCDDEEPYPPEDQYFQKQRQCGFVGVRLEGLTKILKSCDGSYVRAVNDMSIDFYRDELTVIMGCPGAGKSMILSMIAGLVKPSAGEIYVQGINISSTRYTRQLVGLCAQDIVYVPQLTFRENLLLFSKMKGRTSGEAKSEVSSLICKLKVAKYEHVNTLELPCGILRLMQLACALMGCPPVILLDDPTYGLDTETKYMLWDLILTLRKHRTVIMATRCVEEADLLADRIAAVHEGRLQGFATPDFLKNAIGCGYRLTLITHNRICEGQITNIVLSNIPTATKVEQTESKLKYHLPPSSSPKFASLFTTLERNQMCLEINYIGLNYNSMQEVFYQLCSDNITYEQVDCTRNVDYEDKSYVTRSGANLYITIFLVLMVRRIKHTISNRIVFLIFQVLASIIFIVVCSYASIKVTNPDTNSKLFMNLDLFSDTGQRKAFVNLKSQEILRTFHKTYPYVEFVRTSNIEKDILWPFRINALDDKKYIVGIEVNSTTAKVLYSPVIRHTIPVGVNLLSNILANRALPYEQDGKTITTINKPFQDNPDGTGDETFPKPLRAVLMLLTLLAIIHMGFLLNGTTLPYQERLHSSRHLHMMAGCPPALYWLVALLYDILVYCIFLLIPAVGLTAIMDITNTFSKFDFAVAMFILFLLGGIAVLLFGYILAFYLTAIHASVVMFILITLFGILLPVAMDMESKNESPNEMVLNIASIATVLLPPQAFTRGAMELGYVASYNSFCQTHKSKCPDLATKVQMPRKATLDLCCGNETSSSGPMRYFGKGFGLFELIAIIIQIFVLFFTIILIQRGSICRCIERVVNYGYRPPPDKRVDPGELRKENDAIERAFTEPDRVNSLVVYDVHKKYNTCFESKNAITGISFIVNKGQCFGILGACGTGKSTLCRMMSSQTRLTGGGLYAGGFYLIQKRKEYLYKVGYCPQYYGYDRFLSAEDNLRLILSIRGFCSLDIDEEVESWLNTVGLLHHAGHACSDYTYSCTRKLAVAMAFCGDAPVVVLDQPLTGIDLRAKNYVRNAILRGRYQDKAVVVTSECVKEMETLCSKIIIIEDGQVSARGAPAMLHRGCAKGYSVRLRLYPVINTGSCDACNFTDKVNIIKEAITAAFTVEMVAEYKRDIHFRIMQNVPPYSALFRCLAGLKLTYPTILSDYTVNGLSLQEWFCRTYNTFHIPSLSPQYI